MKNKYIIASIVLIIAFIGLITVIEEYDRTYSISLCKLNLTIEDSNTLKVEEFFVYDFKGEYNGVYRDIPIKNNERIENIQIKTIGAFSVHEIIQEEDETRIKVYLYSDSQKTKKISDTNVNVTISYDFINVLEYDEDYIILHYNLWGDRWENSLEKLEAYINFNFSHEQVKYDLSPSSLVKDEEWINNTTLKIETHPIPSKTIFKVYSLTDKQYDNNSIDYTEEDIDLNLENNSIVLNLENSSVVLQSSSNDQNLPPFNIDNFLESESASFENYGPYAKSIFIIWSIAMILNFINPIFIYFKNKRVFNSNEVDFNPKIIYNKTPAFINALWGNGFKKIGEFNFDGFLATVLDLIDRGYINYKIMEDSEKNSEYPKFILLTICRRRLVSRNSDLKEYEKNIIGCLNVFEDKGLIDFRNFKDVFQKRLKAKIFQKNYELWRENASKELFDKETIKKYCNRSNVNHHRTHGEIALILSFFNFIILFFEISYSYVIITLIFGISLGILGLTLMYIPEKYLVKWTMEGKEIGKQCTLLEKFVKEENFKVEDFLKNGFSLDKLLIYGSALGFKKSNKGAYFSQDLKESNKEEYISLSENTLKKVILYNFLSHGGSLLMHESIERGAVVDSSFSEYRDGYNARYYGGSGGSGGGGSGGGGSGGGGGGAF